MWGDDIQYESRRDRCDLGLKKETSREAGVPSGALQLVAIVYRSALALLSVFNDFALSWQDADLRLPRLGLPPRRAAVCYAVIRG